LAPAKAYAQTRVYYELRPGYTFFEGKATGSGPPAGHAPGYVKAGRRKYPIQPQVINFNDEPPRTYKLNDSAAFITRLLLMEVDTDLLSLMYVSRFNVPGSTPEEKVRNALEIINTFITTSGFFQTRDVASLTPAPPHTTPSNFEDIWADFSMGSAYAIGAIKIP
jgi:hypothetical protein